MKKLIPVLVLIAMVLTACNLGNMGGEQAVIVPTATLPEVHEVESLEGMATPTSVEVLAPTETPEVVMVEEEPTAEPTVAEEPTAEPTAEPEPTNTPVPPTATAVPDSGDPAVDNGSPTWREEFASANITSFIQDEDWFSIGIVKDGGLEFIGKQSQIPAWRMAGTGKGPLSEAYMEATIQNMVCNSDADSSGLYFRVPNASSPDQGYLFGITCGGDYYLWRWNGKTIPEGKMEVLVESTFSSQLNLGVGASNRVGVTQDKTGRMVLYINGVAVDEYTSDIFMGGYFGVFVRPASLNRFTINVDQVAYWNNPKLLDANVGGGISNNDEQSEAGNVEKYNFDYLVENPTADPGIVLGPPTWRDYLNSSGNWGAFKNDFVISTGNLDGQLELIGLQKEAAWVLAETPKMADGAIELVLENDTCQMWDSYGIFFRSPDAQEGDRGYLFGVTCNGYYFLWRWDGKSDKMTQLIEYTKAVDVINYGSGARNRLDLVLVDDTIQMYVNSEYLNSYYDSTHLEGYFGVFLRPQYTGGLTVYLDEASYWINKAAE